MIKKFFQRLNSEKVSYILISGQATILYGAATFSEDIDIWIKPSPQDWNKFLKISRQLGGQIYKLTPPLKMKLIQKGHGYHFQFSHKSGSVWFLDVMGKVPRVESFQKAVQNLTYHNTDWGLLPVIGIRELVEIKKTRRLSDYPIISNLVRIEYEKLKPRISPQNWIWILNNCFEISDLLYYLKKHRRAREIARTSPRKHLACLIKAVDTEKEHWIQKASRQLLQEIEKLRHQDIIYWRPVIEELKLLQKKKQLLPEGSIPPSQVTE